MNIINLKKFLPGFISVVIIAGMAASTFATNIDLSAFVQRDTYKTKFYELEWRIDDIDNELDRLYKYTCTNIKSFAGSNFAYNGYVFRSAFHPNAQTSATYVAASIGKMLDTSQSKYLRFNSAGLLSWASATYDSTKTLRVFEYSVPASRCIWRDDIELLPETKVSLRGTLDGIINATSSIEIVMGPFKKFPKITSPGMGKTTGYVCEWPTAVLHNAWSDRTIYYASGSKTKPTSWTTESSAKMYITYATRGITSNSKTVPSTDEDRAGGFFKEAMKDYTQQLYIYTSAFNALDGKENCWVRLNFSMSNDTGSMAARLDSSFVNHTNWNTHEE